MASATFTRDNTSQNTNPGRGFHLVKGLLDGDFSAAASSYYNGAYGTIGGVIANFPLRLVRGDTNIGAFKSSPISGGALSTLTTNFAAARNIGVKVIPRFAYDFSGQTNPDASVTQIQAHLVQLSPILYANRDVIYAIEAGFIGQYGEWHDSGSSGNNNRANRNAVRDALLSAVPPEIKVLFRYPMDLLVWNGSANGLTPATAFTGTLMDRCGNHNDCWMADAKDVGTYENAGFQFGDWNNPSYGSPLNARTFISQQTEYQPYGGETCNAGAMRLNCSGGTDNAGLLGGISNEGPRYHASYLNLNYYTAFYTQWFNDGCFNTVRRSFGYNIVLDSLTHPDSIARGSVALFKVTLRNVGYGRVIDLSRLGIWLSNGANNIRAQSSAQLRQLPSQATSGTVFLVAVTIPTNAVVASYNVHIDFPDMYDRSTGSFASSNPNAFKKQPMNANNGGQVWDATNYRFTTGTTISIT